MKLLIKLILLSLIALSIAQAETIKLVRVQKGQRLMELIGNEGQIVKSYKIMLGKNPIGHKVQSGDNKTPEGLYTLDYKNAQSKFRKSIHISYPNKADIKRAKKLKVNPGGDIMIHGLPNDFKEMREWLALVGLGDTSDIVIRMALPNFDWTSGCIAVLDDEIDEIFGLIKVPTPIQINP